MAGPAPRQPQRDGPSGDGSPPASSPSGDGASARDGRDEAAPTGGRGLFTRRRHRGRYGQKQRRIRERLSAYRAERREARPPRRPRVVVPSFFTLMNLFSGFLALTQIHEGEFVRACQLIILAGFFDALDGLTARLADAASPFGVELDSLSDVVSFGIAPAYLVWVFGLSEFGPLGLIVASLPALCGAVRLARYNVTFDGEKKDYFEGLPIPAQAITIVALILVLGEAGWFSRSDAGNLSVLIPVVFALAALMVSTVRFDAFPKPTLGYVRAHPRRAVLYALALVLLPFLQELALLVTLAVYILYGIGETVYRTFRAVMNTPVDEA